jgi:DNA polymerase-1
MQSRGLLLDKEALSTYRNKLQNDLRTADRTILDADKWGLVHAPTQTKPNSIGSSKKLATLLFDKLGLKSQKKTERGLDSTDQEALGRIHKSLRKKDEHARPVVEQLFHRSRLKTIRDRYLKFDVDPDGRVRATVKMAAVKTWRYAYENPPLQQFPPEARHIYKAGPGRLFLARDYSQLEARILAYLSGDEVSIKVFESNGDVHDQNTCDLFGYNLRDKNSIDPTEWTAARNFSKSFLYGISYGGRAETLKAKEFCPCPECAPHTPPMATLGRNKARAVEKAWYAKHYRVTEFHQELEAQVRAHRYWDCPLGGRRWISAPWSAALSREVKNIPMQTTAAEIMNLRQVQLHEAGAPVVLQKHDEFLLEVPEGEVNYWADVTREIMEAPLEKAGILSGVSFPTSAEVGPNWGQMTEI